MGTRLAVGMGGVAAQSEPAHVLRSSFGTYEFANGPKRAELLGLRRDKHPGWERVFTNPQGFLVDAYSNIDDNFTVSYCVSDRMHKEVGPIPPDSMAAKYLGAAPKSREGLVFAQANKVLAQTYLEARDFFPKDVLNTPDLMVAGGESHDGFYYMKGWDMVGVESRQIDRLIEAVEKNPADSGRQLKKVKDDMRMSLVHELTHIGKQQRGLEDTILDNQDELSPIAMQFLATENTQTFRSYIMGCRDRGPHLEDAGNAAKHLQRLLLREPSVKVKPSGEAYSQMFQEGPNYQVWGDHRRQLTLDAFEEIQKSIDSIPAKQRPQVMQRLKQEIMNRSTLDLTNELRESQDVDVPASVKSKLGVEAVRFQRNPKLGPGRYKIRESDNLIQLSDFDIACMDAKTPDLSTARQAVKDLQARQDSKKGFDYDV